MLKYHFLVITVTNQKFEGILLSARQRKKWAFLYIAGRDAK